MSNTNNKLGRGLSSLLGEKKLNLSSGLINFDLNSNKVQELSIKSLKPNRFQPRKYFNEDELRELSVSIKEYGILQPLVARKTNDASIFEIIAGERRYRAAQIAGLQVVPVIIKEFTDEDALSLAIIENVQRSDLSVIEEAEAYKSLISDFNYTQQDISDFVGKRRSYIANIIRLLDLPEEIKEMLYKKEISMGHARALINSNNAVEIAHIIIDKQLSVRETERLVKEYNLVDKSKMFKQNIKKAQLSMLNEEYFKKIENTIFNKINLKSKIDFNPTKKAGKIVINYSSLDELEDFLKKLR